MVLGVDASVLSHSRIHTSLSKMVQNLCTLINLLLCGAAKREYVVRLLCVVCSNDKIIINVRIFYIILNILMDI